MSPRNSTFRKGAKKLRQAVENVENLTWELQQKRSQLEDLEITVLNQLASGRTIGSRLRDFVILAGNGHFDQNTYMDYQKLIGLCKKKPSGGKQRVIIIQRSVLYEEDDVITLTNILLAVLQPVRPKFFFNPLRIKLEVEPLSFLNGEYYYSENGQRQTVNFTALSAERRIDIGPLIGLYTPIGPADMKGDGDLFFTPTTAVSAVVPIPQTTAEEYAIEHEIDPEDIVKYHREWIRAKAKAN